MLMYGSSMPKSDTPRVWFVVPTCRPEQVERIFRTVESQSVKGHLLIVENGEAIGTCEKLGKLPTVVLQSDNNVGSARSVALRYIRSVDPEAFLIWMDDDDWYHHSYARKVLEANNGDEITMAGGHYVNLDGQYAWCHSSTMLEATLAGPQRLFREADGVEGSEGETMAPSPRRVNLPMCVNRCGGDHTWRAHHLGYLEQGQPFVFFGEVVPSLRQTNPTGNPILVCDFVVEFEHVLQLWEEKRKKARAAR